jgi:hypothetical protein
LVYEDYLTRFGKRSSRVQAGQCDRNFARDAGATPDFGFIARQTHSQTFQNQMIPESELNEKAEFDLFWICNKPINERL